MDNENSEHIRVMIRLSDIERELGDIKFDVARIVDKFADLQQLIMGSLESCAKGYQTCSKAYKDCEDAFESIPDRIDQGVYKV